MTLKVRSKELTQPLLNYESIHIQNKDSNTKKNMKSVVIAINNTLNSKLKLTPMEITYGISKIPFVNEITDTLIKVKKLISIHNLVKTPNRRRKRKENRKFKLNP